MKNVLYIKQSSSFHIKVDICTQKFLDQQRYIKPVTIIPRYIATIQHLFQFMSHILECRRIFYHLICNAMYIARLFWNWHPGIDEFAFDTALTIRKYLNDRNF